VTRQSLDLAIDLRKAFDAGIGTYIRNVVPRVLDRLEPDVRIVALVPHGQADRYGWLPARRAELREMRAGPLTLREQVEFGRLLGRDIAFWATSLAHPLRHRGPIAATVHDVAQLALGRAEGVSVPVSLAARLLLANLRRRATALMAVSGFTRQEFASRVGEPACGHMAVTPLGVDASWFDVASMRAGAGEPRTFVCVGSVRPHKNIARLLQAYAQVAHRVPHALVVAGLAPQAGDHESLLATLPDALRQRVRFTGLVPAAELQRLVGAADALVFPSLYEGFGLPALEAMAAGCPVLASTAGALPEVCGTAAAGSFDPRSVAQIALALTRHAALGATERQAIVGHGIAHARAFTWERTADLTADALRVVLCKQGTSG
jgi:glycosyltransferase involved in cell wall biosynthesis